MKVAFNQRVKEGPWGGGNRFVSALRDALLARGDQVVFDLDHADIDLILIVDPRWRNELVTFTPDAVLRHHLFRRSRSIVVHRINECDERKGTRHMNRRLRAANAVADHTVFIASWLTDLDLWRRNPEFSVILNGADPAVFFPAPGMSLAPDRPIRLVTHHWGAHINKGFDVYSRLDALLADPEWTNRLEFTYIGNLPQGIDLPRTRKLPALDGKALAQELRSAHIYITASINEPAGMHHIEGALCGLPLLYRSSGALPEYCADFGLPFEGPDDMPDALKRLIECHGAKRRLLDTYPHTSKRMAEDYLRLFDILLKRREELIGRRSFRAQIWSFARSLLLF